MRRHSTVSGKKKTQRRLHISSVVFSYFVLFLVDYNALWLQDIAGRLEGCFLVFRCVLFCLMMWTSVKTWLFIWMYMHMYIHVLMHTCMSWHLSQGSFQTAIFFSPSTFLWVGITLWYHLFQQPQPGPNHEDHSDIWHVLTADNPTALSYSLL